MKANILSIVGKSGAGKTTLLEKLICSLKQKGFSVGCAKHAHGGFQMDKKGKDSWRLRKAGANTLLVGPSDIAMVRDRNDDLLEDIDRCLGDMDLVLLEGFKRKPFPKIEIFRTGSCHSEPLAINDGTLAGFVTDSEFRPDCPVFDIDDIESVSRFIEKEFIRINDGK
ncbi:MAG: molybdopterin-guanine dinucleotide biosynthesis protein B [Thermodesulfobacteriota bacterium]